MNTPKKTQLEKQSPFKLKGGYFSICLLAILFFTVSFTPVFADSTYFQAMIWGLVVNVFGLLMGFGGELLNFGITTFVIGFGDQFLDSGIGAVIDVLWKSVRDIFNLTFIFGLVYIGIKMILDSDDSNTRQWLVHLIMAALLVNFSLFITKFVVDISNITATQIIINGFSETVDGSVDVSGTFMNSLGLQTIIKNGDSLPASLTIDGNTPWGYIWGSAALFLVSAFVFAAGGFMLIVRFASLCLYMVLSPLMFIGWVFPQMQKYTNDYWHGFLGKAFFAPIYLLLIYFSARIIGSIYNNGAPNYIATLAGNGNTITANFGNTIPPFILSCIFLISSIIVANKLGADGAGAVMKHSKTYTNGLKRTGKFAVSQTAGRGGRYVANKFGTATKEKISQYQTKKGVLGAIARTNLVDDYGKKAGDAMKNSKFGLPTSKPEDETRKANTNKRYENAKTIRRAQSIESEENEHKYKYDRNTQIYDPESREVVDRDSFTDDKLKEKAINAETARDEKVAEARTIIGNMSQKELEEIYTNDKQLFDSMTSNLKTSQFDKLKDSEVLNSDDKNKLNEDRTDMVTELYKENGEIISDQLQYASIKQIEVLGDKFIRDNADLFTQGQMDSILKNDNFTEGQKGSYARSRKDLQSNLAESKNGNDVARLFNHNTAKTPGIYDGRKKSAEIANLPFEAYFKKGKDKAGNDIDIANKDVINSLNIGDLEAIASKRTLDAGQRKQISEVIIESNNPENAEKRNYLNGYNGVRNWGTEGVESVKDNDSTDQDSRNRSEVIKDIPSGHEMSEGGIIIPTDYGNDKP